MKKTLRSTTAILLLVSSSALAFAQATQPEADRIKTALDKYLGNVKGVVTVSPKGGDYELALDFKPYVALANQPDLQFKMNPLIITLSPQGNGQWKVGANDSPAFEASMKALFVYKYSLGQGGWSGLFDESSQTFLNTTLEYKNISIEQSINDPNNGGKMDNSTVFESVRATSKSTVVSPGIVDSDQHVELVGMKQNMSGMASATPSPLGNTFTISSPLTVYDTTAKGLRQTAAYDLVAWFVAHAKKEDIVRDQAQLKDKMSAALPLWDFLSARTEAKSMTFQSQMGSVSADNFSYAVDLSGIGKNGQARIAFDFAGLAIPQGLVPPWSQELLPRDFKVDFSFADVDLETPARHLISKFDLTKPEPLAEAEMTAASQMLLANGNLSLAINPSFIANAISKLSYDGKIDIKMNGAPPTGKSTFVMTGLDALLEKIQAAAATDPNAQQAMAPLVAAKGLAKPDGSGGYQWVVESGPNNTVLVNGLDVSKMAGP